MDDRKELETWTDTAAHEAWLNVRHQARNTGFAIPEQVRDDAVARIHQIIKKSLGSDTTATFQDEIALKAILVLAKLSATTTSAVSVQAAALQNHVKATGPRDTTEHGRFMEDLARGLFQGQSNQD
jgi:hypothetical protein